MAIDARFAYEPEPARLAVGISRKIKLAQYESAEVSLHVSAITVDTAEAEIDDLLDRQGPIVYSRLREQLKAGLDAARADFAAEQQAKGWR